MAIEGNLNDMHLTDIIQFTCRNGDTARVSLSYQNQEGAVFFAGGQVIHATHQNNSGEKAIYELLGWEEGRFVIEKDVRSPQKTIQTPWNALLLQGMKYLDETRQEREQEVKHSNVLEILQEVTEALNGFVAAHVVGGKDEGVIAQLAAEDSFNHQAAIDNFSRVIKQANEALDAMDAGAFQETIISSQEYNFITRPLGSGQYYTGIILNAEGSIGAARMYLEDAEYDLVDILLADSGS